MFRPKQTLYQPEASTSTVNIRLGSLAIAGGGGVPPANKFESKSYPESPQQKSMVQLVAQLSCFDAELRGRALQELSTRRNEVATLAPLLWHSFGTIATLLKEIVFIYYKLSPPTLSMVESERVGYALVLLQFVVTHPGTRILFLKANIGSYLYPFLSSVDKTRPLEHLRLTSLSIIGTLVKNIFKWLKCQMDEAHVLYANLTARSLVACTNGCTPCQRSNSSEPEVVQYLLNTEIMPECLHSIVRGCDLSKTVATYILQKILSDDQGLNYICVTADRFYAVCSALAQLVTNVSEKPSPDLLKNIIRCYLYLTNNPRARDSLCRCLPDTLRDGTFLACVEEDPTMMRWLLQLLSIVGTNQGSQPGPSLGFQHMTTK